MLDENIPIDDLSANLHTAGVGYVRTFSLFGRIAKLDAIVPFSYGKWTANINGSDTSATRFGMGDPMARLSVIFVGGPALSPAEFVKHEGSRFRLGAFFRMRLPFGEYNPETGLNLGANRWAFKTGIGASYRIKRVVMDAYINAWWFTENKEYLVDNVVSQEAVLTFQGHVTYIFKNLSWLAISLGQSGLGETRINGIPQENRQNAWRFGISYALPLKNRQALKFAYTNGLATRFGADFNTLLVAYQFMWFDKQRNP